MTQIIQRYNLEPSNCRHFTHSSCWMEGGLLAWENYLSLEVFEHRLVVLLWGILWQRRWQMTTGLLQLGDAQLLSICSSASGCERLWNKEKKDQEIVLSPRNQQTLRRLQKRREEQWFSLFFLFQVAESSPLPPLKNEMLYRTQFGR